MCGKNTVWEFTCSGNILVNKRDQGSALINLTVSKLIEETTKIQFMINSISSTMVVYGIVFMIELIVVIFFLLSTREETLEKALRRFSVSSFKSIFFREAQNV